jgi:hypothetical protein
MALRMYQVRSTPAQRAYRGAYRVVMATSAVPNDSMRVWVRNTGVLKSHGQTANRWLRPGQSGSVPEPVAIAAGRPIRFLVLL